MLNILSIRFNVMISIILLSVCWASMLQAQEATATEIVIPTPATQNYEFDGYSLNIKRLNADVPVLVADDIVIELKVTGPEAGGVKLKALESRWGEYEVLEQEALDDLPAGDGLRFWSRRYVLTRNESGIARTGELSFDYKLFPSGLWKTHVLQPQIIEVQSVLQPQEEDPKVIRAEQGVAELPAAPVTNWFQWLVIGLVGVFLLVVSLIILIKALWPKPQVSIEEKTMQAIRDLQAEQLIQQGQYELYYTRLTDIVRAYIEEAFGLKAPNQTTPEFLREISRGDNLLSDHADTLTSFLQQADMVKFAGQYGDGEKASAAAKRFITQSAEQMRQQIAEMKKLQKTKKNDEGNTAAPLPLEGVRS